MKQDALQMSLLFDYYGELLSEKQRVCFDLYYNQDLSLSEIASELGITRQGVHDSLSRAETALGEFERVTGCIARPAHGKGAGGNRRCVRAAAIDSRGARGSAEHPARKRKHKGVTYGI